jgi:hypothetical protein
VEVYVAQSLVFCVVFCRSLFVLLFFFLLTIVLSVLHRQIIFIYISFVHFRYVLTNSYQPYITLSGGLVFFGIWYLQIHCNISWYISYDIKQASISYCVLEVINGVFVHEFNVLKVINRVFTPTFFCVKYW